MIDNTYARQRPADLPKPVADALQKLDDIRSRARQAEQDLAALNAPARTTEAEAADRKAAAEAAAAGKAIPDGKHVSKLKADRDKAAAAVAAYTDAVAAAVEVVTDARQRAAEAEKADEKRRRFEAYAGLTVAAEDLADLLHREAVDRARFEWLRTGTLPQPSVEVYAWDAVPVLLGRGVGPNNGTPAREYLAPAGDVVRRTVAAAFPAEEN